MQGIERLPNAAEAVGMFSCAGVPGLPAETRLTLYSQPVHELSGGALVFEELLLRVGRTPDCVVGPGELLAVAERQGVMPQLDEWVLRRAVAIASTARRVSVNVSGSSVSDPDFLPAVELALEPPTVDASLITFEITETAVVSDLIQASRFAERIRALGCHFALDDFGTGYAGLTYLKHLPIRYLKIDMSFVRDLVNDPRSQALVSGIVALARGFGQQTVAEGIEDLPTLELLRELGVDHGQGFFLGRPRPAEEPGPLVHAPAWIRTRV